MDESKLKEQIRYAIDTHCPSCTADPCRAQRVLNTAHTMQETGGTIMKKKLSVCLILIAIVMLSSIVALAYNHSYVLQYLFGKRMDADKAQTMEAQVQPIEYAYQNGAIACTVKDAYFDGEKIAVGIGFRTDRPLYLIGKELKLNGEWIDYSAASASLDAVFLGGIASPQTFDPIEKITGVSYLLNHPVAKGEEVEVAMEIILLTPVNGVEKVDTEQEDHPAMWAAIDAVREKGLTPISANEQFGLSPQVLISNAQHGYCDPESAYHGPYCNVEALVEYANMEVLDTVKLEFSLVAQ